MKTKNLCILLLVLFFCSLMPLSALAKLKAESQTPEDVQHGKPWVKRNIDKSFDQLRVPVSSSGASNAVRYHVTAMRFTIHGYTAYYDAIGTEVIPGPGQTVKQTIVINAADLAQKMGVGAQQVEQWLNTGDKVYISSTVEIHQGDKVLGTYNDYSSLAAAMRSYGFPEYDVQDAATRWGEADDPQPPQQQGNLKIIDLVVTNSSGQVVSSLQTGQTYYAQANYQNESCPAGQAKICMYQQAGSLKVMGSTQISFTGAAGETRLSPQWSFVAAEGSNTIYASINCTLAGSVGVTAYNEQYQANDGRKITETTYSDNWTNQNFYVVSSGGSDGGQGSNQQKYNLKAVSIKLKTPSGQNVSGPPSVDVPYQVEATFTSYFPRSGYATMRLYKEKNGSYQQVGSEITKFFSYAGNNQWPTTTEYWDITFSDNKYYNLYATIDSRYAGGGWTNDPFVTDNRFEDETTWEDNRISTGASPTEVKEPGLPQPMVGSYSSYYPVYESPGNKVETITTTEPVYGWKKVRFIPAPRPKVHVYLVPHIEEK